MIFVLSKNVILSRIVIFVTNSSDNATFFSYPIKTDLTICDKKRSSDFLLEKHDTTQFYEYHEP